MLSHCFLDFSVGVGAFVIGLSQISSMISVLSEGTRIGALSPLRRFEQVPSYSPHCLVSQSAMR